MVKIRIGNIEYIPEEKDEIILWFKNEYYNAQERLLKEGYHKNDDGSMSKDIITIHPSCFDNEFSRMTVANLEWNRAHDEFDVRSCGLRAFELEPREYNNFKEVLELIEAHIGDDRDE